jgi:hypothetical protein
MRMSLRRSDRLFVSSVMPIALLRCASPEAAPEMHVVHNPAPGAATPEWRVASQPSLHIGREGDSLYEFNNIGDVRSLSDGRIIVANDHSEIRYYTGAGRHALTAGRRGPGPEEFQRLVSLTVLPGDSVAAHNTYNIDRRVLIFDPDGHFSRAFELDLRSESSRTADGGWIGIRNVQHGSRSACVETPSVLRSDREIVLANAARRL